MVRAAEKLRAEAGGLPPVQQRGLSLAETPTPKGKRLPVPIPFAAKEVTPVRTLHEQASIAFETDIRTACRPE